ncbi:hypothetical protein GUJ93_ZPchr0010g10231 [Zizania palustris]|uniref:CCT domain-containing protein n=1 Tax=Zizania palustris TaxID=103762 RepID=A0A8J5WDS2_ZIZPA|nr:hypothetical protein GUJ93_ZPchr0010g10231 [Zizania palustris]
MSSLWLTVALLGAVEFEKPAAGDDRWWTGGPSGSGRSPRFNRQVRYESSKARADCRLRIKGRFVKDIQI